MSNLSFESSNDDELSFDYAFDEFYKKRKSGSNIQFKRWSKIQSEFKKNVNLGKRLSHSWLKPIKNQTIN